MFSNATFSFSALRVLLFLPFFTFTGCSEFLKGKPKQQAIVEIKSGDLECIKTVGEKFKKLADSQSSAEEIDDSFACLNKTLEQFQNKAEGRTRADAFTAEELFSIFDRFFKDAKISQKATDDILVLKKALLGGDATMVTKAELENLKAYLKVLQGEVKKLAPYVKVFFLKKENGPFEKSFLDQAFLQLRQSLKTLLKSSKLGRSQYNFEDVKQISQSLNITETEESKQQMVLIENVINLLSGVEPLESESEYLTAIDNFVDLAELYGSALYTDLAFEIKSQAQLSKVFNFADKMLSILESSVQYKKKGLIPIQFIDPIVLEVLKSKIIPVEVKPDTFIKFYKTAFIRVLNDQKNIAIENFEGLKPLHFRNMRREFYIYKLYQDVINRIDYSQKPQISVGALQGFLKQYNITPQTKAFAHVDEALKKEILQGFNELKAEALSPVSIIYRNKKMILAINQNQAVIGWEDISRALYGKILARAMMIGWGQVHPSQNLDISVLKEEGMVQWYADFKDFGVETKLFDPRTLNAGAKSFLEANLFTYNGNGDKNVDYRELMQFVNMLFSGGGELTQNLRDLMKSSGCETKEIDVFGNPWINEACFVKTLYKQHKSVFSNVFNFSAYIASLNEQQFNHFYSELMVVARNDEKISGKLETADIRVLSMLIMYIESLYGNYDTVSPMNSFSASEIRGSYPRFKAFVTEFAETQAKDTVAQWDKVYNLCGYIYTKEDLFREAFIFMVYNGRLPELEDMNYITCGFNGLFTFTGEVDRKNIINTFKVLKTVLASKK